MGRFKDRHGITRLQALIGKAKDLGETLPPEVIELAGVVSPRLAALMRAYQALATSDNVSPKLREDLLDLFEVVIDEMEHVTGRHEVDAVNDNWASKNIRPYSLFFLLKFNAVLALSQMFGWSTSLPEATVNQWGYALTAGISFYFGGRELTKIFSNLKNVKR